MIALLCRLSNPNGANLKDTLEDEDAMYKKLLEQSSDGVTSATESTVYRGSKVNVPAVKPNVQTCSKFYF